MPLAASVTEGRRSPTSRVEADDRRRCRSDRAVVHRRPVPEACPTCSLRFDSLREYLKATTHLSTPVLYDDISGEIPCRTDRTDVAGELPVRDHRCDRVKGNSLAQLVELLAWAKSESSRRSIGVRELLRHIRDRIDEQVLDHSADGRSDHGILRSGTLGR